MNNQPPQTNIDDVLSIIKNTPPVQLILLITWIVVGWNILKAYNFKRRGKHWASGFLPGYFPYKDLSVVEWLIFGALTAVVIYFMFLTSS